MLVLTVHQLEEQGVVPEEIEFSEQIKCGDKLMHRVADFPLKENSKAIETGKSYLKLGNFSFITKSRVALTVWAEKKDRDVNFATEVNLKIEQAKKRISSQIFQEINRNQVKRRFFPDQEKPQNQNVNSQPSKVILPKDEYFEKKISYLDIDSNSKNIDEREEISNHTSDYDNHAKRTYRGVDY